MTEPITNTESINIQINENTRELVTIESNEDTPLTTNTTNVEDIKIEQKQKLINLASILGKILSDETNIDKLKLKINIKPESIMLMQKIALLFPDLLEDIDKSIADIIADNVLDSSDVPKLMVLIKNVYKKFNDSKRLKSIQKVTLDDSINFIKNLILILIEYEHIKVKDKDTVIIVIDLCIDLLTTSIDVSETLFDSIKSCFKC